VQFFIWYFVVPEILPTSVGDWIKGIEPNLQFFIVSCVCAGHLHRLAHLRTLRAGVEALPGGSGTPACR